MTAYDFPSALHCDLAGIDVILVGCARSLSGKIALHEAESAMLSLRDSVGMVELGLDTTLV